jgi:hypothetical protein
MNIYTRGNHANRRSVRSGLQVRNSSTTNAKRQRKSKGSEFDNLSTMSNERKRKAAKRLVQFDHFVGSVWMLFNCVFPLFMYYRKEKNGDFFREEENGLGVAMTDEGEGGKEPDMPSLMNSGKNITPEPNHNEGNGRDGGNDLYPRKGAGYRVNKSGEESGEESEEESDEHTCINDDDSHLGYGQGSDFDHLHERGKDLLLSPGGDEGMDMTIDGGENLFTNDHKRSKCYYRLEDLNQSMKRTPKTVSEVYSENIQLRDKEANLLQLRKAVRTKLFPSTKFIGDIEKFKCTKEGEEGTNIQRALFKELGMKSSKYNDIDRAIMWNTYSKEVASLLSQCRSSVMCEMKKVLVPGRKRCIL